MSKPRTPFSAYMKRVFVSWSQALNAFTGGNPDETFSSRVGRRSKEGKTWARIVEKMIDKLFELKGSKPGHCQRVIEWDEVV